ncbi:BAG1 [Mytilus coruscus]|uniref:BAG family molecular chaperone regulator 1 n=1 Tax=Mytilus coruscus TaxID=42192 RepID=A0A6J8CDN9_MYTCO|nr:BAG1 [Mytilus coruscus]
MTDQRHRIKLNIKHGSVRHSIFLELPANSSEVLKVQHLMDKMVEMFEIPLECQKIVHKGKTLKDPGDILSEIGVRDGATIMLLGKKPDPQEDKEMKKLLDIEKDVEKNEKRLSDVTYELDGIHRGYINDDLKLPALNQLKKRLGGTSETFMKQLESLDALRFEESNKGGRGKRKTIVDRIQVLLDRCDGLMSGLKDQIAREQEKS